MSKRKKNYPDPMTVVNKYGADALRYEVFRFLTCVAEVRTGLVTT